MDKDILEYARDGFAQLDELGFESEYIVIDHKNHTMTPQVTAESALELGFFPRGTKVRFTNTNGYDYEREVAAEKLGEDVVLTVKKCVIGGWSSTYEFDETPGTFNTVMFERV